MPCGHDILPPVLSKPHLMPLFDLSPELLPTSKTLYCTLVTPRGTNATGEVAHEPGQPDTAPPSPAWSFFLAFLPGLVLPPTDAAFCTAVTQSN